MGVQLDIINSMLAAISTSGISSLTGNHPSLLKAKPVLERHNTVVQATGYWFNTDTKLTLSPNASNEFILPQNTLKADTSDKSLKYVRRNTRMYDPVNHTFEIDDIATMDVDVVIKLDYDDLPVAAYEYIRARATQELVANSDADALSLQFHAGQVAQAFAAFNVERRSQADTNLRDNPAYQRIVLGAANRGRNHLYPAYIGGIK